MILLYFDLCCFCRLFDDLTFARVAEEFDAITEIQEMIVDGGLFLAWSYVLNVENAKSKNLLCKSEVASWEQYAVSYIAASSSVESRSLEIRQSGIKEMDSLHVACAIEAGCQFFITVDYRLLKYQSDKIKICDPIECLNILQKII
jgi:predicted nucleic acid-binding protein